MLPEMYFDHPGYYLSALCGLILDFTLTSYYCMIIPWMHHAYIVCIACMLMGGATVDKNKIADMETQN